MNRMIKTIIVDDELLARKNIKTSLGDFPELQVIAECSNGLEAVQAILEYQPHLVFLDIQMPEMDGFDVINTIGIQNMPFVIFVTAFDRYAIEAFEKHAFDYLLKPFSVERFQESVSRVLEFISRHHTSQTAENLLQVMQEINPQRKYVNRLAIRSTSRIYFLNVEEIDWIESAGNYVDIHAGQHTHLLRETMANMEAKLNPEKFLRIHRSTIVNIDRIQEIQPDGYDFLVVLKNGKLLGMSRTYRDKLNTIMDVYF